MHTTQLVHGGNSRYMYNVHLENSRCTGGIAGTPGIHQVNWWHSSYTGGIAAGTPGEQQVHRGHSRYTGGIAAGTPGEQQVHRGHSRYTGCTAGTQGGIAGTP